MSDLILIDMVGVDNPWTMANYKSRGGYKALSKALAMPREEIIDEVKKANLRGRGGAGFPCGVKWGFLPKESEVPKYLVINADEGEPGTFKDRLLMDLDPHKLVEGCIISSFALDTAATYIYIRGELYASIKRVSDAIEEAYKAGYLGRNIGGTGWSHDIYIHPGAGAYICGEETALIESLEGKAGQPRLKPPFPAVVGVFSCPTIVNNVETIACVPTIINRGGDWWFQQSRWYIEGAAAGDEEMMQHKGGGGPKMVGLSGHVKRTGIFEVPHGLSMHELIFSDKYGGGMRIVGGTERKIKAVIPGGASCPLILADEIDVGMDFQSMADAGTMLGTACATVMDETTCMVRVAANLAHFFHHESCGQCTPCREGTGWTAKVLDDIEEGIGKPEDLELLFDICDNVEGNTICPFGDALAMSVRSYIQKFPDEFKAHIEQGGCMFPKW